jgi:hypothetical protein
MLIRCLGKRQLWRLGSARPASARFVWANCSHKEPKAYVRPPYWVDKGNNCQLTASEFGLDATGQLYVVKNVTTSSLFFPDVTAGKVVGFKIDSAAGFVLLTFGLRSLRLPYAAPPTEDEIIANELSVAEGFVNIEESLPANDLLEDAYQALKATPTPPFSRAFIMDASVSLFRIKQVSPSLSGVSHSSLLQLAYLRSALEKEPELRNPTNQPGCGGVSGEDITIESEIDRFAVGSSCGFALAPNRDGKMPARVSIGNSLIYGGTHVLDGIMWDHDTFVGSRIQYHDGRVSLNALRFINCTFDVIDSPNGDRVVDFAISRPPHLSIEGQAGSNVPVGAGQPQIFPSSYAITRGVPPGLGSLSWGWRHD